MLSTLPILSEKKIPFYGFLKDYNWLDSYLKCQKIIKEVENLRKEKSRIAAMPLHPSDMRDLLEQSWQAYTDRQIGELKRFIEANWANPDIVGLFASRSAAPYNGLNFKNIPDLKFFEKALKNAVPAGKTIKIKSREKELDKIARKTAELKIELQNYSPPKYFMRIDEGVLADIRQEFVNFWVDLQSQTSEPVGIRGLELKSCDAAEQRAWDKLGMKSFVDKKTAKFKPCLA